MTALFILFLTSLLIGQIGAFTLNTGVIVYIHDITLLFFLIGGGITIIQKRVSITPRLLFPISAFILIGIYSLLRNAGNLPVHELTWSSLYLIRWVMYGFLYVILVQKFIEQKTIIYGTYLVGIALAVIGFFQLAWFPNLRSMTYMGWDPHYYRLFSTLLDPNFAGIIFVLCFLIGLQILQRSQNNMVVFGEVLLIIATYFTYSRSSYLSLMISIVFLIWYFKKWKTLIAVGICIVFIVLIPTPGGKTLRLGRVDSSVARIENWHETIQLISKAPFTGYGFNTLKYVRISEFDASYSSTSRATSGVDSSILFILATTGIVGLCTYFWLLYEIVRMKGMLMPVVIVALFVHSLFTNSMFYSWVMILIWSISAASELTCDT